MNRAFFWLLILCGSLFSAKVFRAQESEPRPTALLTRNLSLQHELQRAIDRGIEWLREQQEEEGFWSTREHPAITGLAVMAFQGNPGGVEEDGERLEKAYRFLLRNAQTDGGIYRRGLQNYNTAVSLMALLAANDPKYNQVILDARNFIVGLQSDFGEPGQIDSPFDGGVGYGGTYPHSDMSNTLMALEALYYSRHLVEDAPEGEGRELNWQAVLHFIQSCQNLPEYNQQPWASDDPENKGGFVYFPGHSMAGEMELESGRVALRSYGSISYAGLLSYIYADLKQDDPRVQAVMDWLRRNYTLEENPGMGAQGLFYYFHTMGKALNAHGTGALVLPDGTEINWREDLALKLINLQQADGSWVNENGRWWEKDPALVTSYALITLEMIYGRL
jgi:squalene-hopene/tetraprenyl-beta-curcumene cyclase